MTKSELITILDLLQIKLQAYRDMLRKSSKNMKPAFSFKVMEIQNSISKFNRQLMMIPADDFAPVFSADDLERASQNEMNHPCESKKYLYSSSTKGC